MDRHSKPGEDVRTQKVMDVSSIVKTSLGPVGPDMMEVDYFFGGAVVITTDVATMLRMLGIQQHPPPKNKQQRRRGRSHRNRKLKSRRRFT